MLNRSRVINTDSLASSQWSGHSSASSINDVRRRADSETYRTLLTPDDDRLARFIRRYRTCFVSCARSSFRCSCWLVCCCGFFGRGRAGLCKRQWRSQPTDQSNDCFLHSDASFLIRFTLTVVTQGSNGRYFSEVFRSRRFEWASPIR
jgi:hypothetical protein